MTNITRSLGKISASLMAAFWLMCGPLEAAPLVLPDGAQLAYEQDLGLAVARFGAGPVDGVGNIATISTKGHVLQRVWRIPRSDISPLQMIDGLRVQLQAIGYNPVFECDAQACGGFDFRYALDSEPPPSLYINITDYHYLLVQRDSDDLVWLLASRDDSAGYMQIKTVGPSPQIAVSPPPKVSQTPAKKPRGMLQSLQDTGRAVIPELDFTAGSTEIPQGPQVGLDQLVQLMVTEPSMRIVLVGHTDNNGPFDVNLDLSSKRADAARAYLLANGINPSRVQAYGVSYLSPVANNSTAQGRKINRRVEAVLLMPQPK